MSVNAPSARTLRFDRFEVDLDSGELHRDGARIPLGEQPTQVLLKRTNGESIRLVWAMAPLIVPWFGLADDDSLLVLRDISTHDIYAFDLETAGR